MQKNKIKELSKANSQLVNENVKLDNDLKRCNDKSQFKDAEIKKLKKEIQRLNVLKCHLEHSEQQLKISIIRYKENLKKAREDAKKSSIVRSITPIKRSTVKQSSLTQRRADYKKKYLAKYKTEMASIHRKIKFYYNKAKDAKMIIGKSKRKAELAKIEKTVKAILSRKGVVQRYIDKYSE